MINYINNKFNYANKQYILLILINSMNTHNFIKFILQIIL